jgi:hypothetical protein
VGSQAGRLLTGWKAAHRLEACATAAGATSAGGITRALHPPAGSRCHRSSLCHSSRCHRSSLCHSSRCHRSSRCHKGNAHPAGSSANARSACTAGLACGFAGAAARSRCLIRTRPRLALPAKTRRRRFVGVRRCSIRTCPCWAAGRHMIPHLRHTIRHIFLAVPRYATSTAAPIATGRSESCRVGLPPTENTRLSSRRTAADC